MLRKHGVVGSIPITSTMCCVGFKEIAFDLFRSGTNWSVRCGLEVLIKSESKIIQSVFCNDELQSTTNTFCDVAVPLALSHNSTENEFK